MVLLLGFVVRIEEDLKLVGLLLKDNQVIHEYALDGLNLLLLLLVVILCTHI